MARNDEDFLNKWVNYYGREFGEENLFIYLDGEDQQVPKGAGKSNVTKVPKIGGQVVQAEKGRLGFLSERAAELMKSGYDVVIGCDADEFLVLDPKTGMKLREYVSSLEFDTCKSALGIDVGQHLTEEQTIDWSRPFLQHYCLNIFHHINFHEHQYVHNLHHYFLVKLNVLNYNL